MNVRQLKTDLYRELQPEVAKILPKHIPVGRFVRVVQTAILSNKALAAMDKASLFKAAIHAAESNLYPNGVEAAFVPFKGEVKFLPMVNGLVKLALQSGEVKTISAHEVYEGDDFTYWVDDLGPHVKFNPSLNADRGEFRAAFAVAVMDRGGVMIEVMERDELDKIKDGVLSKYKEEWKKKDSPWEQWSGEMRKKSVIKRLCKRLPLKNYFTADDSFVEAKATPVEVQNEATPVEVQNEAAPVDLNLLLQNAKEKRNEQDK